MQYTGFSLVVSKSQIFSVLGLKTKVILLAFVLCRIIRARNNPRLVVRDK